MPTRDSQGTSPATGRSDIQPSPVLLEQYRLGCELARFWLGSMRRRVPCSAVVLMAALVGVCVVQQVLQYLFLILIPLGSLWMFRETIDDARRLLGTSEIIDTIEVLLTRRSDPWRLQLPSPGTVREAGTVCVRQAWGIAGLAVASSLLLAHEAVGLPPEWLTAYAAIVALAAFDAVSAAMSVRLDRHGGRN